MSQAQPQFPPSIDDPASLTEAFNAFNELSERLSSAYGQLEGEVSQLNEELALSRAQRQREQAQKEQLADRLSALLEALPAAVVLVDGRDRVDRFNPEAEKLFAGLAWGRRWSEVRDESVLSASNTGEWLLAQERRVNVSVQPLSDGGQILVLMDITEQRQLEQRLQRQDRLTDMGEMAAQLAHQVRTPLATALLYGGQLGKSGLSDEQRERFAAQLVDGLRHTEKLVSDMLAFSRGGCFVSSSIHLRDVVEQAIDTLHARLREADAEVHLHVDEGEDVLLGNRDALVGVLGNLIDNSLNHAGANANIWVSLQLDDERAVLSVQDDGPGIPADVRERIFDPFFTTRERGTGLGLAVAQSVVLAHGGSIHTCTSEHGGACFELRLPLQQSPAEGEKA